MADSITTQADMVALEIIDDVEIERLTTDRQRNAVSSTGAPFPWRIHHERAWERTLRELGQDPEPLLETELSDTTELTRAVCYLVACYAYEQGESPTDMARSKHFHALHLREMSEALLTTTFGVRRARVTGYMTIRSSRGG